MNLFRAEWARLFARRFTVIMILIVLGILALIGAGVAVDSQQPSAAATANARQLAERERENVRRMREACEEARRDQDGTAAESLGVPPNVSCAEAFDETWVQDENYLPSTFNFRTEASSFVLAFGGIFAMLAFAVGASFVGAEWASGSFMNLLTWRPRRLQVLLTKLAALLAGLVAIGVVMAAGWLAVLYGIARVRGTSGGPTAGSWTSLGLDTARAVALALAAAVLGFALASLGRHTATALGVAVGWLFVLEIALRLVLLAVEVPKLERWFASTYALAWLTKRVELYDQTGCRYDLNEACRPERWTVDLGDGALVLGIGVAVVLSAAMFSMSRRDVT